MNIWFGDRRYWGSGSLRKPGYGSGPWILPLDRWWLAPFIMWETCGERSTHHGKKSRRVVTEFCALGLRSSLWRWSEYALVFNRDLFGSVKTKLTLLITRWLHKGVFLCFCQLCRVDAPGFWWGVFGRASSRWRCPACSSWRSGCEGGVLVG